MADRLPPLKLTADERMFLAIELDIAADGYVDAAHVGGGRSGPSRLDPDQVRTAQRLRRMAERMRGTARQQIEGVSTRLEDLPPSDELVVEPHYVRIDGRERIAGVARVCSCGYLWGAMHAPLDGHAADCPCA